LLIFAARAFDAGDTSARRIEAEADRKGTVMKAIIGATVALPLLGVALAFAESSVISPNGSRPSVSGAPKNFIGSVVVEPLYGAHDSMPATGGHVTFAPGARSAWHTHPAGQVLIITDGVGWVQEEGGAKREVKPGDVVWCPPGVKHWHGATATNGMRHIAITGMVDGKNVDWMEQVTEEQYGAQ
jgi:quercetin dioxygenase-like cupin family protein